MNEEIDHEYTDEVTCPYCGKEVGDSWELPEKGKRKCYECSNEFEYESDVSVSYTSWKLEEDE